MPRAKLDRDALAQQTRRVRERLLREGAVVSRSDGTRHSLFPVAFPAAEGAALAEWVRRESASRTVEVGLGYGVATLFVCEAILASSDPAPRHVAIDPHQATRFGSCGLRALADAGVAELVELHAHESQIALPRFLAERRRFDLAVVDGNHRFDGVFLDLVYLGRLVRPGAILFLDDYQLPAVARAASFCVTNLGWTLEEISSEDGLHQWAVLRTARDADTRPYDHFVDF